MPHIVPITCYCLLTLGLFWLDRDRKLRTSTGLWVPTVWLLITGSRPVSFWLGMMPSLDNGDVYLEGSPVDRIVYLVLIIAGLLVLLQRSARVQSILRANWPVLLYFGYCAISIVWSGYPDVAFKRWTKAVGDLTMVVIVLTERDLLGALKTIFKRVGFVLIPVSLVLCKYYPSVSRVLIPYSWENTYTGISTTKNGLGTICMVYGLVSAWRFLVAYRDKTDRYRKQRLIAHGILLLIVARLMLLARSMTSSACLAAGIAILLVSSISQRRMGRVLLHCSTAVMLLSSISVLFLGAGTSILQTIGKDPTLTGRTEIWSTLLSFDSSPYLGAGFETFWLGPRLEAIWNHFGGFHLNEAHNGYIEVYLQLGIIGLVVLAILIIAAYRNAFLSFRSDPKLGSLKIAFVVVAVIYSMSEAGFRMMSPTWFFFLLCGMAISAVRTSKSATLQTDSNAEVKLVSESAMNIYESDVSISQPK